MKTHKKIEWDPPIPGFDCVKMMRDIRVELGELYRDNPELERRNLAAIRVQHGFPLEPGDVELAAEAESEILISKT